MTDIDNIFTNNDMVMTDRGYYITGGTFKRVNEDAENDENDENEKVSHMYQNLGIPVGLYYMQVSIEPTADDSHDTYDTHDAQYAQYAMPMREYSKTEIIPDDLYDKLMELSSTLPAIPKKYTRNNRNKQIGKKIKNKKTTRKKY